MTDIQRDILRMLRIFGPCSNAEIARRLGVLPYNCYRQLVLLTANGYASHPKIQVWEITAAGKEVFAIQPNRPLELYKESQT